MRGCFRGLHGGDLAASYWEILSDLTRREKQIEKVSMESINRTKTESNIGVQREVKVQQREGGRQDKP